MKTFINIVRTILIFACLLGLLSYGWKTSVRGVESRGKAYEEYISSARDCDDKGYYKDAILFYQKAASVCSDDSFDREITMDYFKMGDLSTFADKAEKYLDSTPDEEMYDDLITFYMDDQLFAKANKMIDKAQQNYPENKSFEKFRRTIDGMYTLEYTEYLNIGEYSGNYAIALATGTDANEVIVNNKGKNAFNGTSYVKVLDIKSGDGDEELDTSFNLEGDSVDAGQATVTSGLSSGDKLLCKDSDGYTRAVGTEGKTYLGTYHNGHMLACEDGKWFYDDSEETYDDATTFCNNTAAVKRDGKWALMNCDLQTTTAYCYDEVVMDEIRSCSRGGVVFVRDQGSAKYSLVDGNGKELCSEKFDAVKGFLCPDGLAAVKDGGKWGAVNTSGELVIPCVYDELGSSIANYIPYKEGELWGYMDADGKELIEPVFKEARAVNKDGYAGVKQGDTWCVIAIYSIKGEDSFF